MVYGDFKDLTRKIGSDKILCDKAFNIAKNPKYDEYDRGLATMVYIFFDKKNASGAIINEIISNKELDTNQLLKNLKNEKFTHFLQKIFGVLVLLIYKQISKYNKGLRFLVCVIDIFSKYI